MTLTNAQDPVTEICIS